MTKKFNYNPYIEDATKRAGEALFDGSKSLTIPLLQTITGTMSKLAQDGSVADNIMRQPVLTVVGVIGGIGAIIKDGVGGMITGKLPDANAGSLKPPGM